MGQRARNQFVLTLVTVVMLVEPGCSGSSDPASKPGSGSTTSAAGGPAIVCDGIDEFNQDDDGAVRALLQPSQLPAGDWTPADPPPCPWALSADELLATPECRSAAAAANAPANDEARNGNAHVTFSGPDDIELDDRVEIYTSRQNIDAIRAILVSSSMPECYSAALRRRATTEPGTRLSDVRASRFTVEPNAAALGLGFPAVAGYAADAGFADGVDLAFTRTTKGRRTPVAMRVITFGSGGLMTTLTMIASTIAELETVDLTDTLRAAAKNYIAITSPSG